MPPMTLRIYCSFCSAEVRNDSNICPSCGRALDDVTSRRLEQEQPHSKETAKTQRHQDAKKFKGWTWRPIHSTALP